MSEIAPEQITYRCMDCSRERIGPRPYDAPARASVYVAHCGCRLPHTVGRPYYLDVHGKRIE